MLSNILCFLVSLVLKWHIYKHLHIKSWRVTISLFPSHHCPLQLELWQAATPGVGQRLGHSTKMHSVVWQMADECTRLCPQPSHECGEKTLGCVKHANRSPLHASTPLKNIRHCVSMLMIRNYSRNISGRMGNREKNTSKPSKKILLQSRRKKKSLYFPSIIFSFF